MQKNTLSLQSDWSVVKEKIKESNVNITDEDLLYAPGQELQLLERLSSKTKMSVDEVRSWIESISSNSGKAS